MKNIDEKSEKHLLNIRRQKIEYYLPKNKGKITGITQEFVKIESWLLMTIAYTIN